MNHSKKHQKSIKSELEHKIGLYFYELSRKCHHYHKNEFTSPEVVIIAVGY